MLLFFNRSIRHILVTNWVLRIPRNSVRSPVEYNTSKQVFFLGCWLTKYKTNNECTKKKKKDKYSDGKIVNCVNRWFLWKVIHTPVNLKHSINTIFYCTYCCIIIFNSFIIIIAFIWTSVFVLRTINHTAPGYCFPFKVKEPKIIHSRVSWYSRFEHKRTRIRVKTYE
jgi:hypothetical protein